MTASCCAARKDREPRERQSRAQPGRPPARSRAPRASLLPGAAQVAQYDGRRSARAARRPPTGSVSSGQSCRNISLDVVGVMVSAALDTGVPRDLTPGGFTSRRCGRWVLDRCVDTDRSAEHSPRGRGAAGGVQRGSRRRAHRFLEAVLQEQQPRRGRRDGCLPRSTRACLATSRQVASLREGREVGAASGVGTPTALARGLRCRGQLSTPPGHLSHVRQLG